MRIEWAYCMAIILICLNVFRTCNVGSLSCVMSSFIEGMYVVARAPDVKTKSGHLMPATHFLLQFPSQISMERVGALKVVVNSF